MSLLCLQPRLVMSEWCTSGFLYFLTGSVPTDECVIEWFAELDKCSGKTALGVRPAIEYVGRFLSSLISLSHTYTLFSMFLVSFCPVLNPFSVSS